MINIKKVIKSIHTWFSYRLVKITFLQNNEKCMGRNTKLKWLWSKLGCMKVRECYTTISIKLSFSSFQFNSSSYIMDFKAFCLASVVAVRFLCSCLTFLELVVQASGSHLDLPIFLLLLLNEIYSSLYS